MSEQRRIQLQMAEGGDVAYLKLPGYPEPPSGVVKRTVRLRTILGEYSGPDLYFDFDDNDVLIGVEVLV